MFILFLKSYFIVYLFYLFLAGSGLSCGMQALLQYAGSSLRRVGFPLVVARRFSLSSCVAQAAGHMGSVVVVRGFQSAWALQFAKRRLSEVRELSSHGARHVGSQFPNQESNQRPLHCKADSLPLDHEGSPQIFILKMH